MIFEHIFLYFSRDYLSIVNINSRNYFINSARAHGLLIQCCYPRSVTFGMPRSPTGSKVTAGLPIPECNPGDRELSDGEEENQSLETSHNGRWQKTKQQVSRVTLLFCDEPTVYSKVARDVPGIDAAYLAMDTENGVEVVWNEVCYSNRRASRGGHGKVRSCVIVYLLLL